MSTEQEGSLGEVEHLKKELQAAQEKLRRLEKEFVLVQEALGWLDRKFNVIQELYTMLNSTFDTQQLLEQALYTTIKALNVEVGSILMVDEKTQELYFEVATGPKAEEVKQYRLEIGEGIAGWSFQQNETVAISEVEKDARFKREISEAIGFPVRNILCAPIRAKSIPIGVIELLNKRESNVFIGEEVDLLNRSATLIGIIYENARLLNELKKTEG